MAALVRKLYGHSVFKRSFGHIPPFHCALLFQPNQLISPITKQNVFLLSVLLSSADYGGEPSSIILDISVLLEAFSPRRAKHRK